MALFFGITAAPVEHYLYDTLPLRPPGLAAIEAHAATNDVPIIGPLEGQFLYLLALSSGAHDLLDIGTATGYSAAWLGLAAQQTGGRVVSLERDLARAALAEGFWRDMGLAAVCTLRPGDALTLLRDVPDRFDFIFNDILTQLPGPAEAETLTDLSIACLRPGGLLIADNALRKGGVADPANRSPGVLTMHAYLDRVRAHPDLETVILPLRDGLAISRRKTG